jgi:hypothetical protein
VRHVGGGGRHRQGAKHRARRPGRKDEPGGGVVRKSEGEGIVCSCASARRQDKG